MDPVTRGDPEAPLRWTWKSTRQLAEALKSQGHQTSHRMVAEMPHALGYRLQGNRKTLEEESHPDRNAQFEYIHRQVTRFQGSGLDTNHYPKGAKVSNEEMATLNLRRADFHGEWNYSTLPQMP